MQNGSTLPPVQQQVSPGLSFLTAKPGSNLAWYVKDATQGNWLLSRLAIIPATVLDGLDFLGDLTAGAWNAGVHLSKREYKLAANDATGAFWACLTRVAIASNNIFTIIDSGTRALEAYTNEMKPAHARQAGSQSIHVDIQAARTRVAKDQELERKLNEWLQYVPETKRPELDHCIGNDVKLQKAKQLAQQYSRSLETDLQTAQERIHNMESVPPSSAQDIDKERSALLAKVCKFLDEEEVKTVQAPNLNAEASVEDQLAVACMYLDVKLENLQLALKNLNNQLKNLENENKTLKDNTIQLLNQNKTSDENLRELKSKIGKLEKENNTAKQQLTTLELKNNELTKKLNNLSELEAQLAQIKQENENLKSSLIEKQNNANELTIIETNENSDTSDDLSDSSDNNLNDSETSDLNESQNSVDDSQSTDPNLSSYSDYHPTPEQPKGESRLYHDNIIPDESPESKNEKVEEVDEIKNEEEEVAPEQALHNLFAQLQPSIKAMDQGKYPVSRQQNQTITELLDSHNQLAPFYKEWKNFGFGQKKGKYIDKSLTPKQHKRLTELLPTA